MIDKKDCFDCRKYIFKLSLRIIIDRPSLRNNSQKFALERDPKATDLDENIVNKWIHLIACRSTQVQSINVYYSDDRPDDPEAEPYNAQREEVYFTL